MQCLRRARAEDPALPDVSHCIRPCLLVIPSVDRELLGASVTISVASPVGDFYNVVFHGVCGYWLALRASRASLLASLSAQTASHFFCHLM